jgi:hypothetical protein
MYGQNNFWTGILLFLTTFRLMDVQTPAFLLLPPEASSMLGLLPSTRGREPSGPHVPGDLKTVYNPGDGSKKESKKRIEDQLENFDKVFSPEKDTGPEKDTRNKEI